MLSNYALYRVTYDGGELMVLAEDPRDAAIRAARMLADVLPVVPGALHVEPWEIETLRFQRGVVVAEGRR